MDQPRPATIAARAPLHTRAAAALTIAVAVVAALSAWSVCEAADLQAAPELASPASAAAAVERPIDVEPRRGHIDLPSIKPSIRASAEKASVPAAAPGVSWAVSSRPLHTRAESDHIKAAMLRLLLSAGVRGVRVEALHVHDDWRVVGWPFTRRGDAQQALALLAARGMKVEVVEF